MDTPIADALKKRGISQAALARQLSVDNATVCRWAKGRSRVRAERVLEIESLTGISRHVLRPDLYGLAPLIWEAA